MGGTRKGQLLVIDDFSNIRLRDVPRSHRVKLIRPSTGLSWVEQELGAFGPENTVIFLNAHIRFNSKDFRCSLQGSWFLRYKLRTEWRRRDPVVVYSPLALDEFLEIPHNSILRAGAGHYYLPLAECKVSIRSFIQQVVPIPSASMDLVVSRYGTLPALIKKYAYHDLLINEVGKDTPDVNRITRIVQALGKLIPEQFHESFDVEGLTYQINHLKSAGHMNDRSEFNRTLEAIRNIIKKYGPLADALFKEDVVE
jgi:hypothetical protein